MISPDRLKQLMKEDPSAILLDVRDARDYAQGHIPGAASLPANVISSVGSASELEEAGLGDIVRKRGLPAGAEAPAFIVYCYHGVLSAQAAKKLADLGYRPVYDAGGISDWPYALER